MIRANTIRYYGVTRSRNAFDRRPGDCSRRRPLQPSKLYYSVWRRAVPRITQVLGAGAGITFSEERLRLTAMTLHHDDDVEGSRTWGKALRRTRPGRPNSVWFGLPPKYLRRSPVDQFVGASRVGPVDVTEDDLFRGLR